LKNANIVATDQPDREELIKQFKDIDKKPFEEIVMERAGWTNRLKKSWMVELDGKPITTFDTIRKNHATFISPLVLCEKNGKRHPGSSTTGTPGTPITPGTPATSGTTCTTHNIPVNFALVTRTLVRLVFDRPGWPIERFMSKRELLEAVKMIVKGDTYPYTSDHTC
jgi:hypothetical protein